MPFADTHVHFHFPDFDADRDDAIDRARQAGAELFINVGTDAESSQKSLDFALQYPDFYASAGLHPNDAHEGSPEGFARLEELLKHPRVIAVGEVGLDYYRDHCPKEKQIEVFRYFIRLHKKINKPLILHCRDAYQDMAAILKEEGPAKGIMHCFSSDRETMRLFVDMGFYISFAGPLTYKKNDALREACKACPLDQLLFETDAPFLPPQTKRGKRNESVFMLETFETGAMLHGLSLQALGEKTTENARRVLNLC